MLSPLLLIAAISLSSLSFTHCGMVSMLNRVLISSSTLNLQGHVLQTQELIQIFEFKTHPVYSLPSLPIFSLNFILTLPYQLVRARYHLTSIFDIHLFSFLKGMIFPCGYPN